MAGEKVMGECKTKDGKPARVGERAYNPKTGRHVQITLNRALSLLPTPRAGNPGSRPNKKDGKILAEEVSKLTSSQAAFPASPSPRPASERENQMTAGFGRRCFELYGNFSPLGSLAKMLMASSAWHSDKVSLRWIAQSVMKSKTTRIAQQTGFFVKSSTLSSKSVMPSKHLLFRLAVSALPTDGIGCGLLPTARSSPNENRSTRRSPSHKAGKHGKNLAAEIGELNLLKTPAASDGEGGVMEIREGCDGHYKLRDQIAMLPTPQAIAGAGKGRALRLKKDCKRDPNTPGSYRGDLKDHIAMLPTPATRDYKGANGKKHMEKERPHMDQLPNAIAHGTKTGSTLRLEPVFVEFMMGYPLNYTDLNSPPLATGSKG